MIRDALDALAECDPRGDCTLPLRRCLEILNRVRTSGGFAEELRQRATRQLERALWYEAGPKLGFLVSGIRRDIERLIEWQNR